MKSSPATREENETLVVDMINKCNLFALNMGVDAAKIKKGGGKKALANKLRSLADSTVIISHESLHKDRYVEMERTILSLHDLAQKSREFKEEM